MSNQSNKQIEQQILWVQEKDSCNGCSRFSKEKKCESNIKTCNCNKPELLCFYLKFTTIGFCKNCGHFIIKIGNDKWKHYTRAYKCCFPYFDDKCNAPQLNTEDEIKLFNLQFDKMKKDQIIMQSKDTDTKTANDKEQKRKWS